MAQLPYLVSASVARRILEMIKEAHTPTKFTPNYLSTTLGFEGANDKAFAIRDNRLFQLKENDDEEWELHITPIR